MAEAAVSLSPNRETQRMLRHRSAVMTLARMRAKKAVLLALRAQGLNPHDFSVREIAVLTGLPPGQEVFVKSTEIERSPNTNSAVQGEIANG
jgi:hypothetical protein